MGSALANNTVLEFLGVSWNGIKAKGAHALSRGLRVNRRLQELDLSWNGFLDDGTEAISVILSYNKSLKIFDVSSNGIHLKGGLSNLVSTQGPCGLRPYKMIWPYWYWKSEVSLTTRFNNK